MKYELCHASLIYDPHSSYPSLIASTKSQSLYYSQTSEIYHSNTWSTRDKKIYFDWLNVYETSPPFQYEQCYYS